MTRVHAEAERTLRVLWDQPRPEAFGGIGPGEDGRWMAPSDDPCAQGLALVALAQHAKATGDTDWAQRVFPAVAKGVEWLLKEKTEGRAPTGEAPNWI